VRHVNPAQRGFEPDCASAGVAEPRISGAAYASGASASAFFIRSRRFVECFRLSVSGICERHAIIAGHQLVKSDDWLPMPTALLVVRLILMVVFALAGVAKLADLAGSRRTLNEFGLPRSLAAPASVVLPVCELLIAIALFLRSTAVYGAVAAAALLGVFMIGIGRSLALGRRPHCRCFGQLYSQPVSWKALARNGALGALTLVVVVGGRTDPGPSVVTWLLPLTAFERAVVLGGVVGLALSGVQSALLVKAIRRSDQLLALLTPSPKASAGAQAGQHEPQPVQLREPMPGHAVGTAAPSFALPTVQGDIVTLDALRAPGKPVVLVFSDPDCGPCAALLPVVGEWQRSLAPSLTIALLSRGSADANRIKANEHGVHNLLLQRDREVASDYGILGTPSALVVRSDGSIDSPVAQGEVEIRQLVTRTAQGSAVQGTSLLVPAPDFALSDLDGRPVTLKRFRGKDTLVLFWNPKCSFCQEMLQALRAWEAQPQIERAELLVISTGSADENRALELQSTILLDPQFAVASLYGARGTPSAVMVDADGRLASAVAVGAPAVMRLAGQADSGSTALTGVSNGETTVGLGRAPLTTLPPGAKPAKRSCVLDELLPDGSMVLYNGCQHQVMTLNSTAAFVWECCDAEHDLAAIATEMRDVFPTIDLEEDVRQLVNQLLQADMIEPAPTVASASRQATGAAV
jgi:peroxiredoxin/uncharacterized membrane protein YphA (DoxX/SURF4 family)